MKRINASRGVSQPASDLVSEWRRRRLFRQWLGPLIVVVAIVSSARMVQVLRLPSLLSRGIDITDLGQGERDTSASPPVVVRDRGRTDLAVHLALSAVPSLGQTTTVHLTATRHEPDLSGSDLTEVELRLPAGYQQVSASPSDCSVVEQPSGARLLIWTVNLSVLESFSASVQIAPQAAAEGVYLRLDGHVRAAAAGDGDLGDGVPDVLYLRAGSTGQIGAMSEDWPNGRALMESGISTEGLDSGETVTFADGAVLPLDSGNDLDIPEDKPVALDIDIGPSTMASGTVTGTVLVKNTLAGSMPVDITVNLPPQWQVLQGDPEPNANLAPGQTATFEYLLLPARSSCTWAIDVLVEVPPSVIAVGHEPVLGRLRGGYYPCAPDGGNGVPSEGVIYDKPFIERLPAPGEPPESQITDQCLPCTLDSQCPIRTVGVPAGSQPTMLIDGYIYALSDDDWSFARDLRLRVWAATRSPRNTGHRRPRTDYGRYTLRLLGERTLERSCAYFEICVPRAKSFVLEMSATDATSCNVNDYSVITVPENGGSEPYWAFSDVKRTPSRPGDLAEPCVWSIALGRQNIDQWPDIDSDRAEGFFLASRMAYEISAFMARSDGTGIEPKGNPDYRTTVHFPELPALCLEPPAAPACYHPVGSENIWMGAGMGRKSDTLAHEYGHRAHSTSNPVPFFPQHYSPPVVEGFAQAFMWTVEDYEWYRGSRYEYTRAQGDSLRGYGTDGDRAGYDSVGPYWQDVIDTNPGPDTIDCAGMARPENSSCAFRCFWDSMMSANSVAEWIPIWLQRGLSGDAYLDFKSLTEYHQMWPCSNPPFPTSIGGPTTTPHPPPATPTSWVTPSPTPAFAP